eukprot:366463-Chlamydomonas_euryale.AAC.12
MRNAARCCDHDARFLHNVFSPGAKSLFVVAEPFGIAPPFGIASFITNGTKSAHANTSPGTSTRRRTNANASANTKSMPRTRKLTHKGTPDAAFYLPCTPPLQARVAHHVSSAAHSGHTHLSTLVSSGMLLVLQPGDPFVQPHTAAVLVRGSLVPGAAPAGSGDQPAVGRHGCQGVHLCIRGLPHTPASGTSGAAHGGGPGDGMTALAAPSVLVWGPTLVNAADLEAVGVAAQLAHASSPPRDEPLVAGPFGAQIIVA